MSTVSHQPRRVGPRPENASAGSKVTPRRNSPETSEPAGVAYDSDELPVLIRLPNLLDLAPESAQSSRGKKRRHRIDRPSGGKPRTPKHDSSKAAKKSFHEQAGNNKLILGGIVGGIAIVVALFLLNSSGPDLPSEEDGWAVQEAEPELLVHDPEIMLPSENEPLPLYHGFVYETPEAEPVEQASSEQTQLVAPFNYSPEPTHPDTFALPSPPRSVDGWPTEEPLGPTYGANQTPAGSWPGEELKVPPSANQYPTTDSSGQVDYRSSMYGNDPQSYRTGMLNLDRPQPTDGNRGSSILDGNIEIPDTTSYR